MESDVVLNEDLKAIADSLADIVIARQLSAKDVLLGVHAFLMALHASGHADAEAISEELVGMASYYGTIGHEVQA